MYPKLRRLLFRLDPERAHGLALAALRWLGASASGRLALRRLTGPVPPDDGVTVMGMRFANRLGLAAGYDKDGVAIAGLAGLGFGHLEIGTVTLRPQRGRPRPRIFRLVPEEALINRMGFPSRGSAAVRRALARARRPAGLRVGVSLGLGAATGLEAAAEEFAALTTELAPMADYLAVNLSSPNTAGLRRLQARAHLEAVVGAVVKARDRLDGPRPPVVVKLAPDLGPDELEDALAATLTAGGKGVVIGNTTVSRPVVSSPLASEAGGLSGRPLFPLALAQLRRVAAWSSGRLAVIGCGGVSGSDHLRAMLEAGADLVQIYTALVFQGPAVVGDLLRTANRAAGESNRPP